MTAPGLQHVQWSAADFYWAVIDTTSLPRRLGPINHEQLGYLFERSLPLPIDDVHAVYVRIGKSKRYVACGVDRARLSDALLPDALSLAPEGLPDWIDEDAAMASADRFNLLTGEFEPRALRRPRRRAALEIIAAILVVAAVLVIGFERRIAAARNTAGTIESQRTALLQEVLANSLTPTALPSDVRMTAELRTLRQTRTTDAPSIELTDVSERLAMLLGRWPAGVHLRTQSLSATADSITLRGLLESVESSQTFVDAFQGLPPWRVQQPSVRTTRDGIDMELRLTAAKAPGPGGTP